MVTAYTRALSMATLAPMRSALIRIVAVLGLVPAAVVTAATVASADNGYVESGQPGEGLSVVETLLLYVVIPGAIFLLITLIVVGPSLGKGPRHRTGAALESGPVWIDSTGAGRAPVGAGTPDPSAGAEQGGASARW
jgi:hypothetical protein